jgi:AcrR family transcriptional regulator
MSEKDGIFRSPGRASKKRRKQRTADESQREITEAAIRFLLDHPFRELTVDKLMAGTPLSRPAFYQYFEDLHHLIETLLAEMDAALRASANPWITGDGDPIPALRESLRGVAHVCVEYGPVLRTIVEAAPLDAQLECAWSAFLARWDEAVAARIEALQQAGLVAPFDARQMAYALNRLDVAVFADKLGRRPQADPEALVDVVYRIWLSTLYGNAAKSFRRAARGRRRVTTKRSKRT